ncbi:hypothetical protein MLD38_023406 [Melastoma candidum]|uniref:Uncharacterized protein n=1 Tax=Melastoma candidum TaxID=119954 RepID=A0ACB9QRE4_9MYRT|nr:hypothetical protein MLD38_023406 [Melastoma candidum]
MSDRDLNRPNVEITFDIESTSEYRIRTKSAVEHSLRGLKFITAKDGRSGASGWPTVEKKFDQLTASSGGLLHFSLFGECIGMNKESKELAGELFRALAQRRNIFGEC